MLDPQPLTSAPFPAASESANLNLNHPRSSQVSNLSPSSRPTTLNISTSDVSSTVLPQVHQEEDTPPTSAISSQPDSQGHGSPVMSERKQHTVRNNENGAAQVHRSNTSSQSPPPNSISGAKRTSSGEVKRSSVTGLADVVTKSNGAGHAQTPSMVSNGNVSELSQQLRTKLKYAMIKVQNGWQTRSLDEIESLASQSPRSTTSGFNQQSPYPHSLSSPKTVMSRKYQRESSESGDSSDSTGALESRGLVNMGSSPQVSSRRALAPPVDIVPSSRRRPTATNGSYHNVNGPQLHARGVHTSRPHANQRTPSQNAAMEADAVETLLFMASPSNSSYNPASSQESTLRSSQVFASQTSPLRTQFSQTSMASPKKVAFSDGRSRPPFDKASIIDQMLNELSDGSDDELEQAFRLAGAGKSTATAPVSI
ncbi:hypothetical protein LTR67_010471 [Exophiala xenobiotica]